MPGPKMVGMSAKRVKTRLFPQTFGCTFQPAPRHGGGARCPGMSCRGVSAGVTPGRDRRRSSRGGRAPARIGIKIKERLGALSQSLFCFLFPCVASVLPEDDPGATAVLVPVLRRYVPRCYGGILPVLRRYRCLCYGGTLPGPTTVLIPVLRRYRCLCYGGTLPHAAGVRSHGRLTSRLTRTALRLDAMPVWIV
jgi:hypothetical protein